MKSIRKRFYLCAVACILGTAASILYCISMYGSGQIKLMPLLLLLSAAILAAALVVREAKRLSAARLIVENQFLHIKSADVLMKTAGKSGQNIEAFVSCFGLLLDSKIIKFNQDGILLKAVEIGSGYLSLDYGTDTSIHSIRLIYAGDVNDKRESLIEKFRYETGVIPTISIEKE